MRPVIKCEIHLQLYIALMTHAFPKICIYYCLNKIKFFLKRKKNKMIADLFLPQILLISNLITPLQTPACKKDIRPQNFLSLNCLES